MAAGWEQAMQQRIAIVDRSQSQLLTALTPFNYISMGTIPNPV